MTNSNISYEEIKAAIKEESYFHDQCEENDLVDRVMRSTKEDAVHLIDEFCHYDLPSDAVVGREWNLPQSYINGVESIDAPYWEFSFPEFIGFIKSVEKTDEENILKVEYWIYRSNAAHCSGYYGFWDSGKALVNIKTHRRWNVE